MILVGIVGLGVAVVLAVAVEPEVRIDYENPDPGASTFQISTCGTVASPKDFGPVDLPSDASSLEGTIEGINAQSKEECDDAVSSQRLKTIAVAVPSLIVLVLGIVVLVRSRSNPKTATGT